MEYLFVIIVVIIFLYAACKITIEKENKENERVTQEWKLINELKINYKRRTKKELEKELKLLQNDYKKLIDEAHKEFKKDHHNEEYYDKLYGFDKSYNYAKSIDYMLYMKYKTLKEVLDEGLYATETTATDYTIFAYLKYVTKDGIEKKTRYSAKIKFDAEDGDRICFIYNAPIKKKKKDIGKLAFLLYSYIDKVEGSDDDITIYLKHPKTMKKYVEAAISVDCVVKKDNIIIKLETETPKEICKEIKKRLKDIK